MNNQLHRDPAAARETSHQRMMATAVSGYAHYIDGAGLYRSERLLHRRMQSLAQTALRMIDEGPVQAEGVPLERSHDNHYRTAFISTLAIAWAGLALAFVANAPHVVLALIWMFGLPPICWLTALTFF
jgi:hypothetical protein